MWRHSQNMRLLELECGSSKISAMRNDAQGFESLCSDNSRLGDWLGTDLFIILGDFHSLKLDWACNNDLLIIVNNIDIFIAQIHWYLSVRSEVEILLVQAVILLCIIWMNVLISQLENALSQDIWAMENHLSRAVASLGKLVDEPGSSLKTRSVVDIHLVKLGLKLVDGVIGVWSLANAVHKFGGGFALFRLATFLLTSS